MAASVVSIYNLALQKLGAQRVEAIDEDSKNARSCNVCYEHLRDDELRSRDWRFAISRQSLAASATVPVSLSADLIIPSARAFPVPSDCLRIMFPPRTFLDWTIESIDGRPAIITKDSAPLAIRYIRRVTDPTEFDVNFTEMLACRMAYHMCEEITQSNTKQDAMERQYERALKAARRANAIEAIPREPAMDSWDAAREIGGNQAPWLSGQDL